MRNNKLTLKGILIVARGQVVDDRHLEHVSVSSKALFNLKKLIGTGGTTWDMISVLQDHAYGGVHLPADSIPDMDELVHYMRTKESGNSSDLGGGIWSVGK